MFVYQGKLSWGNAADDETFTIILPKGVVRVEDPVYLFSQWTKNAEGVEKDNWFETIIVKDLKKLPDSDEVAFTLAGAKYTFNITTEQNYWKIKVDISDRFNSQTSTVLAREWETKGTPVKDTSLRIWTGKITWEDSAINEQVLFTIPEGYGEGRPVIASWQWTKDGSDNPKAPGFKGTSMKAISSDSDFAKFSFNIGYFDVICTWNLSTEKLSAKLKRHDQEQEVGDLVLSAKVDAHKHDFDPIDPAPPGKKELEVRRPQPQPSLLRVLDPLPFPRTLHETLTQTYAFVDQAGYLAIQAQNRFAALDASYHEKVLLLKALEKDKENLETEVKSLTTSLKGVNAKFAEVQNQLAAAVEKQDELQKTIQDQRNHDITDEALINDLQNDLNTANDKVASLFEKLNLLKIEKEGLLARGDSLEAELSGIKTEKHDLILELEVQKECNEALRKEVLNLTKARDASNKANAELQAELARTKDELAEANNTLRTTTEDLHNTKTKLTRSEADLKSSKKMVTNRDRDLEMSLKNHSKKIRKIFAITNEYEDLLDKKGVKHEKLANELRALL